MKYCVYSRYAWFWIIWSQVWAVFDFCVLYFDPLARQQWWFLVAAIVQPVLALLWLVAGRKRRGFVRLTAHGDGYRWEIL